MTALAPPTLREGSLVGTPPAGDTEAGPVRVVRAVRVRRPAEALGGSLTLLGVVALGIVLQLLLVGRVQHARDQRVLFDQLRSDLANGTTPVGPIDYTGRLVRPGTPVALVEIPRLHLREVVAEGTSSSVTEHGPGHRRDSVLPGQAGVSILMGRATTYGGPFAHLGELRPGDTLSVTTGQGVQQFRVTGARRAGDPTAPLTVGASRLTLMTADGRALLPRGVLRVDADLTSPVQPAAQPLSSASLDASDKPMAADFSHVFPLILWLQLLLLAAVAAVWARARWGRWQTWLAAAPVLAFVGAVVAEHVTQMLPNLL